jgi:2'-5' RNA ligase
MLQVKDRPSTAKGTRVFVGIKIAPEVADELAQLAQRLERFPTRFVPSTDIHLTLVPPWDETSIQDAIEQLREALNRSAPFMLTFPRLAYWPDRRHPRLLCAECAPTPEIRSLQSALLQAIGQTEDKPFEPHVTLARMQRGGIAAAGENELQRNLSLAHSINSVELFQSGTQVGKGYQVLASLPLGRRKWRDLLGQTLSQIAGLWRWGLPYPGKGKEEF